MAQLRIPKQYQVGIKKLYALNDKVAQELLYILTAEKPVLSRKKFIACVSSKVEGVEIGDIEEIISTLLALHSFRAFIDKTIPDFVEDIAYAQNLTDLEIPSEGQERIKERLVNFLSSKTLSVTAKALDVLTEHERVFDSVRIITDVRSIFGEGLTDIDIESPLAAVVIHMLKIRYNRGGDLEEFYVALDTEDIVEVRKCLERAEAKARNLKAMLNTANVPYMGVDSK